MKEGHHLKFTQYLKILTLNRGGGGIFGKSKGAMAPRTPPPSAYAHHQIKLYVQV